MDVKFLNATVVTCDGTRRVLDHGGVVVLGDRIKAVGPSDEIAALHAWLPTIDAQGKAILPGIVNAHTHVLLLALRGTIEDMGAEVIYGYMTPISFANSLRALDIVICPNASARTIIAAPVI